MKYWFLGLSLLLLACNNGIKEEKKSAKGASLDAALDMDNMSEMAKLMERMNKEHEVVKAKILKGDTLGEIPDYFYDIHFATFTDEHDNDDNFKNWAKLYIAAEENLYASTDNVKDAYNNAINVCIQCHQQKCGGPIPRIKKLLIK
ncbi:hypothetical protein [Neptunitalea lumnitzerae]|uniref:Uncharacterized protein n=1 Tax=Neptunitalea lumnitzerae TaxID=2965509 RepID=A0ABQ5MMJ9_9FLAO|nr:hypothetical protein [Neptunitalea sp. Y10]GLB50604.1 hypothetical protein Y10_29720 [Neptunitalea sp. Y10]